MNSPEEHIEQTARSIREALDEARLWLDDRFESGTMVLHRKLGSVAVQIDHLAELLNNSHGSKRTDLNVEIKEWRQELSDISARAVNYAVSRSILSQKNAEWAEHFYRDYWSKISEFQASSGKYLLIAHATAIVTLFTAIPGSWHHADLVILLASSIVYFMIGIAISLLSLYAGHIWNIRMQKLWRKLTYGNIEQASEYMSFRQKVGFIVLPSLFFGINRVAAFRDRQRRAENC